jgi:calcineurin-like phosphoesterase family protein
MIFFTADTHFFHKNIIEYSYRPFSSIEEMNETIIQKWNNKVNKDDLVYHLGDFIFGNITQYRSIRTRLNGKIILIRGDHDKLFDATRFVKHTYNLEANVPLFNFIYDKQPITLCHWCMRVWAKSHYNSWHLYAHSHGNLEPIGKSHDVGVDNNNFEPLSFEEIKQIMENCPDNFNLIKKYY